MANIQLNEEQLKTLSEELAYLKNVKTAELEEAISLAEKKKLSDSEIKEAHDDFAKNKSRIAILEELLADKGLQKDSTSTQSQEPISVTLEGLVKLMAELDYLLTTRRQEIKEAIKIAKGFGDLSENSEYDEAREEQGKVESRIVELQEMLKNAVLIDEASGTDQVNVGSKVRVFNKTRNKELEYHLVGSTEANASLGKISDQSPIGKALIGERVGSIVTVEVPAGTIELEILEITK